MSEVHGLRYYYKPHYQRNVRISMVFKEMITTILRHRGLVDGLLYQQSRIALAYQTREHPGGNLKSATGHTRHNPPVRKTVRLSCHLTQGLFMREHLPLHWKEGIFNWSFQHCSVAMAFGGLRKIILGRKDTSSCSSSNITNDLSRVLFFPSLAHL